MRMRQVDAEAAAGRADELRLPADRPAGQVAVAGRASTSTTSAATWSRRPSRSARPRSRRCTVSRRTGRSPTRRTSRMSPPTMVRSAHQAGMKVDPVDRGRPGDDAVADRQGRRRDHHATTRTGCGTSRGPTTSGCRSSYDAPAVRALPSAHAHNDYDHRRPLQDALDRGFNSVEADVWLIDGELRVAHDLADAKPGRTLESLYLKPLADRVRENHGQVYKRGGGLPVADRHQERRTVDVRRDRQGAGEVPRDQHDLRRRTGVHAALSRR